MYAFSSASNNNGSAFGGLTVTSDWFQSSLGMCMLLGRFLPIVFVLGIVAAVAIPAYQDYVKRAEQRQ